MGLGVASVPVEPPEFDILVLFERTLAACAARKISPVRYLAGIGDEPHRSVPGYWRPNLLRACPRKQVYKAFGVRQVDPPFDAQRQFNFDRGVVFEAWVVAYLKAAEADDLVQGVTTGGELTDGTIGGKYDVVFWYQGYWYLVEVKSKDNAAAMAKMTAPERGHEAQYNDYLHLSGIGAGFVLYVGPELVGEGKTQIKFRPFFRRPNARLWGETRQRVEMLSWFKQDAKLLAPKTDDTWFECRDCPYRWACDRDLSPAATMEVAA